MLESAYESLERSSRVSQDESSSIYNITSIAGVLLPVAERIDPGLVNEYLWRSLAMRQPNPWETIPRGRHAEADVQLAMMLARYDRAIARTLVEPLAQGTGPAPVYFSSRGELYVAAAAIDPKWAVALVEALPDDPDLKMQSPKNSARLAVATVLGRAGDQRFRKLQHSFLHLWIPDIEDIDPVRLKQAGACAIPGVMEMIIAGLDRRPEYRRGDGWMERKPPPAAWRTSCPRRATHFESPPLRTIGLASEKPDDLIVKVTFRSSRQRYAQLRFGSPSSVRVTLVLDELGRGAADLLRRRRSQPPDRSGDRVEGENRTWRLPLDVAIVDGETTRYERRAAMFRLGATGITFSYAAAGYLEGKVEFAGHWHAVRRMDGDGNGLFTDPQDRLWIDLNDDGRWDSSSEQFLFALDSADRRCPVRGPFRPVRPAPFSRAAEGQRHGPSGPRQAPGAAGRGRAHGNAHRTRRLGGRPCRRAGPGHGSDRRIPPGHRHLCFRRCSRGTALELRVLRHRPPGRARWYKVEQGRHGHD